MTSYFISFPFISLLFCFLTVAWLVFSFPPPILKDEQSQLAQNPKDKKVVSNENKRRNRIDKKRSNKCNIIYCQITNTLVIQMCKLKLKDR